MADEEIVRVTTHVALPPEEAFEIFTAEVDQWWRQGPRYRVHPDRLGHLRFEPRVGGRLLEVYDDAGDDAFVLGHVRAWDPPKRLVFEMGGRDFGPGDPMPEVEVRFRATTTGTEVELEQRGWAALPADHPARHGLSGEALVSMMGLWWADLLVAFRSHRVPAA